MAPHEVACFLAGSDRFLVRYVARSYAAGMCTLTDDQKDALVASVDGNGAAELLAGGLRRLSAAHLNILVGRARVLQARTVETILDRRGADLSDASVASLLASENPHRVVTSWMRGGFAVKPNPRSLRLFAETCNDFDPTSGRSPYLLPEFLGALLNALTRMPDVHAAWLSDVLNEAGPATLGG